MNKQSPVDTALSELRHAVIASIDNSLEPILTRQSDLQADLEKETSRRNNFDSKRSDMIARLAAEPYYIKKITKAHTDYIESDYAIAAIEEALAIVANSSGRYSDIKQLMESVCKTAMQVIGVKINRSKLEIEGRATNIHDNTIRAELNSLNNKAQQLIKSMEDHGMDIQASGEALVKVATSVLDFQPQTTQADQPEKLDVGYKQNKNNAHMSDKSAVA